MKHLSQYRPSGAMVVAIVALVLAAAGTATAAGFITSGDIVNNTVRSKDIRNNTVRSRDVRNHTLLRRDFRAGQLQRGPRGFTGAAGAAGHNGTNGFGTLAYPADFETLTQGTGSQELDAVCPAGTFPTGGAADAFDSVTPFDDVGETVIQSQFLLFDGNGNPAGYGADFNTDAYPNDIDAGVEGVCANANNVLTKAKQHRHKLHR